MAKVLFVILIVSLALALGFFMITHNNNSLSQNVSIPTPGESALTTPEANAPTSTVAPSIDLTKLPRVASATAAIIHTVKGDITIQFYPEDAPKTVMNFATLAKAGYYNNLTFHRVEPGFVIQGGDPNGNGTGGESIYGPTFEDELNATTSSYKAGYMEGVVAMANRGPNTNGSQFFIMLADNTSLPHAYTIFGKVTQGMDVVHNIQVGDKMTSIDVTAQ
jgi:cyclophilin family peptidyl-prolyl cis-trans isomerase